MSEQKEETIDILLASYNGEKYIKEQINSILNQTYTNIRLIISDDCSQDKTKEILEEFAKKDNRIIIHVQPTNLGYIKNFEFLLKQVKNNLYMLSDQDDVWLPEKVEKTVEKLKEKKADLVFGDLEVVDAKLETINTSFNDFMLLTRKINKYIDNYQLNYLYNCITGCTVLAKKEFISKILPIPAESKYVVHDHWIGIMMSIYGKVAYMPEKYIKYRQHGNNQIGTNKISHKFTKLEQVRKLFLEVKLGVFGVYVENNNRFPKPIQELNIKALQYFKMLQNKKNFNFKQWNIFHELYKTETKMYYIENFIIMNLPLLGKGLFKIRHGILKIMGKR